MDSQLHRAKDVPLESLALDGGSECLATNANALARRRVLWVDRATFAVIGIVEVWMVVIYVITWNPSNAFFVSSDSTIASSTVANPAIMTPMIWSFGGVSLAVMPLALYQWYTRSRGLRLPGYRCGRVTVQLVCLMAAVWPLTSFIAFIFSPLSVCTQGSYYSAYGGWCQCDRRPLREAHGTPLYTTVPPNLTIAFVGDTDLYSVEKVYALIRSEQVDAVVLNGDMDYWGDASDWDALYQKHLAGIPFYTTVGNHETWNWRDYQDVEAARRAETGPFECRGSIGVRSVCTHQGVGLLLSGAGTGCGGLHNEHTNFFQETLREFEDNDVTWRICAMHMPEAHMTLGTTESVPGADKYELCRKQGAMIITSHSHLYGRTHELANMTVNGRRVSRQVSPGSGADAALVLGNGTSFAVVTGLGGGKLESGHPQMLRDPIWAATWENSQYLAPGQKVPGFVPGDPIDLGVFFCSFHVLGNPELAHCYFKDIRGRLVDDFYVRRPST